MHTSSISIHVEKDTRISSEVSMIYGSKEFYSVLHLDRLAKNSVALFVDNVEQIDKLVLELMKMKCTMQEKQAEFDKEENDNE